MAVLKDCHQRLAKVLLKWCLSKIVIKDCPNKVLLKWWLSLKIGLPSRLTSSKLSIPASAASPKSDKVLSALSWFLKKISHIGPEASWGLRFLILCWTSETPTQDPRPQTRPQTADLRPPNPRDEPPDTRDPPQTSDFTQTPAFRPAFGIEWSPLDLLPSVRAPMLLRPLLGAPSPVPSLSCFIFYTRWSVLRRSRCSKVPVSASLSKGRPDSLILWKPRKRVADLFHSSFLSQTSTHLVCSVKLFQTSPSLSSANTLLNTESRKLNWNLNWFSSKQTQWLSIPSKNKQNKETPGQHSLTPSSRRSTPTRPNFHTPSCRSDQEVKLLAFSSKFQTLHLSFQPS